MSGDTVKLILLIKSAIKSNELQLILIKDMRFQLTRDLHQPLLDHVFTNFSLRFNKKNYLAAWHIDNGRLERGKLISSLVYMLVLSGRGK